MSDHSSERPLLPESRFFGRGWRFLVNQLIQDVPGEFAACEFDCRVTDCPAERWTSCERRLLTQQGIEGGKRPA